MRKADYDLYDADNIEVKPNHVEAMHEMEREDKEVAKCQGVISDIQGETGTKI